MNRVLEKEELSWIDNLSYQSEKPLGKSNPIDCFRCGQFILDEDKYKAVCPNCNVDAHISLDEFVVRYYRY